MEAERLCGWNWRGGREYPSYKPRTPSSLISSLDKWMKEDFCPRAFTWILVLMTSMGWIYIEIDELNKTRVDREKEKRNLKWKKKYTEWSKTSGETICHERRELLSDTGLYRRRWNKKIKGWKKGMRRNSIFQIPFVCWHTLVVWRHFDVSL